MAHPFASRPTFVGLQDQLFGFGQGSDVSHEVAETIRGWAAKAASRRTDRESLWDIIAQSSIDILNGLAAGDRDSISAFCRKIYSTNLTFGFMQGEDIAQSLRAELGSRLHIGTIILDRFYRLAEAVGVCRVKSGEHGQSTIEISDLDVMFEKIEEAIGADLSPPRQNGELFGLKLARGIFSDRHFDGIYAAWRLRQLALAENMQRYSVLEIGGGAGHLAFYSLRLGADAYRIVDLPHVLLTQYVLLASDLGPERVGLGKQPKHGVGLISAGTDDALDFGGWPIVVNVDSLPEMPSASASAYIRSLQPGQIMLSINQESAYPNGGETQNVVADLASEYRLVRLQRYPAWLRTGYVEEIYRCLRPA